MKIKLSSRSGRARILFELARHYLNFPKKRTADEFDQLVLDCAKAIKLSRNTKGKVRQK